MRKTFKSHGWRGAIGLIAAYAFVIQSILAAGLVTQAAASGALSYPGTLLVICPGSDESAASAEAGAPIKHGTQCPICVLATSGTGTAPPAVAMPAWQSGVAAPTAFVVAAPFVSFHRVRAGLSRAPPRTV